jgi:rhomboid protease GluP
MSEIVIDKKEEVVMNLVHYFVTEKDYNPVVVHGINDEVWLENMHGDYKIVRIISRYIHNNEQLGFNRFRSKQIVNKLRLKTLTFKMNVLSIYVNLGDNVSELEKDDGGDLSVFVNKLQDFKNNPTIISVFPDIIEKTNHSEEGLQLLFKITDDITKTNEKKNKKMEKIFSTKKPIMTYAIIALCIIMFLVSGGGYDIFRLVSCGGNLGSLVRGGEVYRLVTAMFLHVGIFHLILNMYSLYVVGPRVEDFFGKWKFLLIYFVSGIAGNLMSASFNSDVVSVGASGAIFGLFGALAYFGYNYRGYLGAMIKSQIVPIIIYNLFMGFIIPGIDMWGHIGGLVGGLITSYAFGTIENKKYPFSKVMLLIVYLAFLVYMCFFRAV